MGRNVPLRVWGPSGPREDLGTAYALDHMEKMLTWDLAGRAGNVDPRGYQLDVTEFDYKGVNQVIYRDNGVTIRSFPPEDREPWEAKLGVPLEFSEFTESGYWDVDDVLRPIYEEASEVVGRKFEYPGGSEDE